MDHPAHTAKSRVAAISIFASAGMATAKFAVGIAIGSLALISEALHSSVDVVATVVTWMVVRVSDRPADEEHHYGHGKLESLSALGIIAMLYVLAGGILVGWLLRWAWERYPVVRGLKTNAEMLERVEANNSAITELLERQRTLLHKLRA